MLSGYIKVNDQAVGYWEAVRKERVMYDVHYYDCALYYRNNKGHPMHAEFRVAHAEEWGAVQLAGTVIRTGHPKLKGYPPGGDQEFPV